MALGAVVCLSVLATYILRGLGSLCGAPGEAEALQEAMPALTVHLRKGNEKLGLCLRAEGRYATITGIAEGDLLDWWNKSQQYSAQQVRVGDRILAVSSDGKVCREGKLMAAQLKDADDVTLTIGISRTPQELEQCFQRIVGMVALQDLALADVAEFGPPELSSAGPALDKVALEVRKVGPRLVAWNEQCQLNGACYSQQLEVGDRLVSIGGSTKVSNGLKTLSPTVTLVRWKPIGGATRKSVDVAIERASAEDRLGMVICPHPLGHGPATVLRIIPDGAVSRWNAGNLGGEIHPGDAIVSVNGAGTYSAIQKELASLSLTLRVERWEREGHQQGAAQQMPTSKASKQMCGSYTKQTQQSEAKPLAKGVLEPFFWLLLSVALLLPSLVPEDQLAVVADATNLPTRLSLSSQGTLALPLLAFSWLLLMRFIWCEVSVKKTAMPQPFLAFLSSTCFGYGTFFLCNWAGVHS